MQDCTNLEMNFDNRVMTEMNLISNIISSSSDYRKSFANCQILRKSFMSWTILLLICLLSFYCAKGQTVETLPDTLTLFDKNRSRAIPIAIYFPSTKDTSYSGIRPAIMNHGYGFNQGNAYLRYTYLTQFLANAGYFVISIQHELPDDELLPLTGDPLIVRRPFWERGADNMLFVLEWMKIHYPLLDFKHLTLIGHSNGGDMTALFPQKYPDVAENIITLDHRRMPLPRDEKPRILSLRSSDQVADEGVLPDPEEQRKWDISIIFLSDMPHNDMDDHANNQQRENIRFHILQFLKK